MTAGITQRLFKRFPAVIALVAVACINLQGQVVYQELSEQDISVSQSNTATRFSDELTGHIDSLYRQFAADNNLPGIAYAIIIDTSVVCTGSAGFASLTERRPVTESTAFRAASMTKSFTAMAIMKLRDEGRLNLDDPVHKYLPELKDLTYLTADAPVLTIRHLLTHTGGFPQDDPWADRQLATTVEELSAILAEGVSMSNVPGISYEYSNLGYTLLGKVIRAVTGESYQDYIAANIFKPLGMSSTVWEYSDLQEGIMAHGYRYRNGKFSEEPLLHDGPFGAMGGLISTVGDFARYAIMHLLAWPARSDPETGPVRRSTIREMHSPSAGTAYSSNKLYPGGPDCDVIVAYGYGLRWSVDCMGRRKVYHNGGLPGFGSNWTIMPDYGIGIVAFSNRTYGSTWPVNQKVLELIIKAQKMQPMAQEVSSILRTRMNELVHILPGWDISGHESIFADNFFTDYEPEDLRARAEMIFSQAGKIMKIAEIIPENSLRGSFVMEGSIGNITVAFTLTPEATPGIQEFNIEFTPKE